MIDKIRSKAMELGFYRYWFFQGPSKPFFIDEYRAWINSGRNSGMSWMERNMENKGRSFKNSFPDAAQ